MGAVAVILGRAGSKGLPGKNLALVGGRPCARWTIDAAQSAKCVSRIILSTDSQRLQTIGVETGIDVVARPPELATDDARVDDAVRHALEAAHDDSNDPVVILYANVPVRPPGLIDRAVDLLDRTGADSAQSYTDVGKHHPWWTARVDEASGAVQPWEGDVLNHGVHRRQDLPPAFIPDGGVLIVTRRALFLNTAVANRDEPHAFLGGERRGVITQPGDVIDIDAPIDLLVADAILSSRSDIFGAAR